MSFHPTDARPPPGDLSGPAYSPGQLQQLPLVRTALPQETPLPPSESGLTLVTYDPCYFTPVPSAGPVFPALFESARDLHDHLHNPGAVVDEALVSSEEAHDFSNITPFAPSLPHDTPGAQAILAASPYVPTPLSVVVPTTPAEEGPLSAPTSNPFILPHVSPQHASAHLSSAGSMHDSQLPLPSLTPSPVGQVVALVDRLQHELLFDDYTRDAAVRELVSWVAHTYTVPDASGILWDAHWAPAIHEAVDRERRNVDKLRAAAAALGFDLVPKKTDKPSTGRKRTRLGSLPPSPTRTPDHYGDASSMETRLPRLKASIHLPTTPNSLVSPIDPVQKAILEQLGNIGQTLASFNVKFTNIEARLVAETGNLPALPAFPRASPLPPDPTNNEAAREPSPPRIPAAAKGKGRAEPAIPFPEPAAPPADTSLDDFPALPKPALSFATVSGWPRAGIIKPPGGWTEVGKNNKPAQRQTASKPIQPTKLTACKITTVCTIFPDSLQLTDMEETTVLHKPTIREARRAMERLTVRPLPILRGRSVKRPVAGRKSTKTGKIIYSCNGPSRLVSSHKRGFGNARQQVCRDLQPGRK